jgi:hypothetical protein
LAAARDQKPFSLAAGASPLPKHRFSALGRIFTGKSNFTQSTPMTIHDAVVAYKKSDEPYILLVHIISEMYQNQLNSLLV